MQARFISVRVKILAAATLVGGLALAAILGNGYVQMTRTVSEGEMKRYEAVRHTVVNDVEGVTARAEAGILSLVSNPDVREAFARRDRDRLAALTVPVFAALKDRGVEQLQFHIPPATAFFRAHMPDKYGDDLSGFRATVVECNRTQEPVKGLEEGRGGLGFRVVVPVSFEGRHIGSAEYGMGFSGEMLARWKEQMGGEFFVYPGDTRGVAEKGNESPLIAGTREDDPYAVAPEVIEEALGTGEMKVTNTDGGRRAVLVIPLTDYRGAAVAYVKAVQERDEVLAGYSRALYSTLALMGISIAAVAGVLYLVLNIILRPVGRLRAAAEALATGDLTARVEARSNDEIGILAESFRRMADELRQIVGKAAEKADAVAVFTSTLNNGIQQTASGAAETAATVAEISAEVDRLEGVMREISSASESASRRAAEGGEGIARIDGQMKNIAESTGRIARVIDGLSRKSREINQITTLIADIADQTNLLALNAAIEAARAGDQGRGFAVVAEEVRKLAEQSAPAAGRINGLIDAIRGEAEKAVASVTEGGKQVEVGAGVVREVGGYFNEIAGAVTLLTRRIEEAAAAAQRMAEGVRNVTAYAEEQSAAVEGIAASVESLKGQCDEMKALVGRFRL